MFPRPIQQASAPAQWLYAIALPIALILWLFPLLGVALTSLRPASDLAQGNYFGLDRPDIAFPAKELCWRMSAPNRAS